MTGTTDADPAATSRPGGPARPRITGPREDEILDATLTLLGEVGYDRLTMDAVAAAARAGKASLYRRWANKAELVVDTLGRADRCVAVPAGDTGSLRGDLLGVACGDGGLTDQVPVGLMAGLLTAMHHDGDLRQAFDERFMRPRMDLTRTIFRRAVARGEIDAGIDVDLLVDVLPGLIMQRLLMRGQAPTPALITQVVDDVLLPAARRLTPT